MTQMPDRRAIFTAALAVLPLAACSKTEDASDAVTPAVATPAPALVGDWMSWEGGVDVVGLTDPSLAQPNVIIHLARMVHTPVGSAPSGMVLYMPDPKGASVVMGFVSTDPKVGAYFGPKIFKGTPFESAPVLTAGITITDGGTGAGSKLTVGGHVFEVSLDGLGPLTAFDRAAAEMTPFLQRTLEAAATKVTLKVDGKDVVLTIPPIGLSGGAAAVWAPSGFYAR